MAGYQPREEIRARLLARIEAGELLLSFGAGIGLTAQIADRAGADIISVYSTAAMRMGGSPSLLAFLPYMDCNAHMWEMARQILPVVRSAPCVAGLGAHDPSLDLDAAIAQARELGFSGITNEPFVGIYGQYFADQLDAAGIGFSREVELISKAAKADMFSFGWAFNAEEARRMAAAGADVVGAMIGATEGGMTGAAAISPIEEATRDVEAMVAAAKEENENVMVFAHGGPFKDTDSVRYVFQRTGCVGYASGSSGERMPTESAVSEGIQDFRSLRRG